MTRVALYVRVSTGDQTCENQLRDLREYCAALSSLNYVGRSPS
jgi:DNA invertase Pin-like site-specific DNA recombinase